MSHSSQQTFSSFDYLHKATDPVAWITTLAYGALSAIFVYYILLQLNYYPLLPVPELVWNVLVYLMPSSLVAALEKRTDSTATDEHRHTGNYSDTRTFAAKSQTMRRMLGLDGTGIFTNFQTAKSLSGIRTVFKAQPRGTLPGLGNWDNSCYQNSVIQGLAALPSLDIFLTQAASEAAATNEQTTIQALTDVTRKLNDPANAGQKFWTPPELKTMSSWQQQDAQEYYSKILNEVDKESLRLTERMSRTPGLVQFGSLMLQPAKRSFEARTTTDKAERCSRISETTQRGLFGLPEELASTLLQNPLEGLLAQRVGCLKCGFVEGLSLIPFNCLTLPLGKQWEYDIQDCLDDYTALETIGGVECSKCTLLRQKQQLQRLLHHTQNPLKSNEKPQLSESLRLSASSRLDAVLDALENEDFSESTISKKCQVSAKGRVETDKSKQAVIARLPQALVVHVNRSVFNERTGMLSKNHAQVRFPKTLDLTPWCLGKTDRSQKNSSTTESWNVDPFSSMLDDDVDEVEENNASLCNSKNEFLLRAVITHYGRHENGHYICYRRSPENSHPDLNSKDNDSWWRLSDDEVSEVSEEDVLDQGGVFMLFYERVHPMQITPAYKVTDPIQIDTTNTAESANSFEDIKQVNEDARGLDQSRLETSTTNDDEMALSSSSLVNFPRPQSAPRDGSSAPSTSIIDSPSSDTPIGVISRRSGDHNLKTIHQNHSQDDAETNLLPVGNADTRGNRKPSLQMRTAGARKMGHPGNAMPSVSSMVTAN
ncbi:hypothetical protein MMC13_003474 [Lambiella insularis]|nr:hypothetical protein [Lambiella insularis]